MEQLVTEDKQQEKNSSAFIIVLTGVIIILLLLLAGFGGYYVAVNRVSVPQETVKDDQQLTQETIPEEKPCVIYRNENAKFQICIPQDWLLVEEDGSKGVSFGYMLFRSPEFADRYDEKGFGASYAIEKGASLSINATLSSFGSIEQMSEFWALGRGGHAVLRKEDIKVAGVPSLYHVLGDPVEGNQIDTHLLRGREVVYDMNYYYNGTHNPEGEAEYRKILNSFTFLSGTLVLEDKALTILSPEPNSSISLPQKLRVFQEGLGKEAQVMFWVQREGGIPYVLSLTRTNAVPGEYEVQWSNSERVTFPPGQYTVWATVAVNGKFYKSTASSVTVL